VNDDRDPRPPGVRGALTLRLLVVAAALGGLVAMHGLSDHGTAGHAHHSVPPAASIAAHGPQEHISAPAPAPDPGDAGHEGEGGDAAGAALAGLCLAIVLSTAIGIALVRLRRVRPLGGAASPLTAPSPLRPGRRDRDPPCPYALSVLRT